MRQLPSGTVTPLFTDIEGSTRLLHELGSDAYSAALTEHRRLVREAGRLWGAIEAEAERGRIGQWEEGEREEYEQHVAPAAGPDFDRGFREGRALPLDRAVEYALSVDSPT